MLRSCSLSESSSSTRCSARFRFRLELGTLNKDDGDEEGKSMSVSWLGNVTMGGWSYVVAVDVGGSEGGSCEERSLNGMGKSLG